MSFEDDYNYEYEYDYDYDDNYEENDVSIQTWRQPEDEVPSVLATYERAGKQYVVSGCYESHFVDFPQKTKMNILDMDTGTCLRTLQEHTYTINCLAIQTYENGLYIVSGSSDHTVNIWDEKTGVCLYTLRGHRASVMSVATYRVAEGYRIVSGSYDNTVKIWNGMTGSVLDTILHGITGSCLRTLRGHHDVVSSVTTYYDTGGQVCIVSGSYDKTIKVWDATTGECRCTLRERHRVRSVTTYLNEYHQRCIVSGSDDETIKIWSTLTYECMRTLVGHTDYIMSVAVSSDGRRIFSGSADAKIQVWDANTGASLRTLTGAKGYIRSLATCLIAGGSDRIVSCSGINEIKVWDPEVYDPPMVHRSLPFPPIHLTTDAILDKTDDGTYVSPISLEELDPSRTVKLSDGHCYSYDDIVAYYLERIRHKQSFVSPLTRGLFTKEDLRIVKQLVTLPSQYKKN